MSPPIDKDGKKIPIKLGDVIWFLPKDPQTQINPEPGILEAACSTGEFLIKVIDRVETYNAMMGARIIAAEKRGVESAEAARIHHSGINSTVGAFARTTSHGHTLWFRFMSKWNGFEIPDWTFALADEYDVKSWGLALGALTSAREGGFLPSKSYHKALVADDLYDGTYEEYLADLEADKAGTEPPIDLLLPENDEVKGLLAKAKTLLERLEEEK
jgi:hypothetical protein